MTVIPGETVTAAADAIHFAAAAEPSCMCLPAHPTARYEQDRERAVRALEAAAPLIAAAERDRIRRDLIEGDPGRLETALRAELDDEEAADATLIVAGLLRDQP